MQNKDHNYNCWTKEYTRISVVILVPCDGSQALDGGLQGVTSN